MRKRIIRRGSPGLSCAVYWKKNFDFGKESNQEGMHLALQKMDLPSTMDHIYCFQKTRKY